MRGIRQPARTRIVPTVGSSRSRASLGQERVLAVLSSGLLCSRSFSLSRAVRRDVVQRRAPPREIGIRMALGLDGLWFCGGYFKRP